MKTDTHERLHSHNGALWGVAGLGKIQTGNGRTADVAVVAPDAGTLHRALVKMGVNPDPAKNQLVAIRRAKLKGGQS